MALIDRIKYDGDPQGHPWLIYKYPGESFVLGSQLIVGQGQEALFFKGGKALDLFGPDTYTLHTGNLPLLNRLVNLPFGGKTPFTAEIYYINKTSRLDMNWGTSTPFQLEDPKYGILLSIRCHGTYGIRIDDSRMFVSELVGVATGGTTLNHLFVSRYFSGLLTSRIKTIISAFMIRQKISFLEVTPWLQELSQECEREVKTEFQRFGAELVNFFIETVSPPKEEFEKLRQYKEELALGGDFYTQRRSLDILEKMADNPNSGGIAGAGLGLGMGIGMAQNAGGMFGGMMDRMNIQTPASVGPSQAGAGTPCPKCGAVIPAGQKFCGSCGTAAVLEEVCPQCGAKNPAGQKFCGNCGGKLHNQCSACGADNPPSQKFCGNCGAKL